MAINNHCFYSFFRLLKVRREYRKFFRANAGKKIYGFTIQRIVSVECKGVWGKRNEAAFGFSSSICRDEVNMPFLPTHSSDVWFIYPDAEIFPGLEEQHAIDVSCGQQLACQALHLPGWSAQRTAENLPSLEGRTLLLLRTSPLCSHISNTIFMGIWFSYV